MERDERCYEFLVWNAFLIFNTEYEPTAEAFGLWPDPMQSAQTAAPKPDESK